MCGGRALRGAETLLESLLESHGAAVAPSHWRNAGEATRRRASWSRAEGWSHWIPWSRQAASAASAWLVAG